MNQKINLHAFKKFYQSAFFGSFILLFCLILSLVIANSSLSDEFNHLLHQFIGYENATIDLNFSVEEWVNDVLMTIFFLLVGLEIKRELVEGELSSPKKAMLPIFAAFGGAIVPAFIFFLFNNGSETVHGWGIPMATDIAFALAVISTLGKSVPASLKIFLAALAIVDDLIAILVIALFYSSDLHVMYLLYAGLLIGVLILFNKLKFTKLYFYIIPGLFIWYFILHSGIHATIAGVVLAFTIPTNDTDIESPLEKLERLLTKPVNLLIIPLFALVNTNITYEAGMVEGLATPLGLGIIVGLLVGKVIGIAGTCFLLYKTKIAYLPENTNWKHMIGIGLLGGIGFTMSIFISNLSFADAALVHESKFSILIASVSAAVLGFVLLKIVGNKK